MAPSDCPECGNPENTAEEVEGEESHYLCTQCNCEWSVVQGNKEEEAEITVITHGALGPSD